MKADSVFRYSLVGRNRGFSLSICWLLFLALLYFAFPQLRTNILSIYIVSGTILFSILHICWDVGVRKNHRDVVLSDLGLTFVSNDKKSEDIKFSSIVRLEDFPSEDDINDTDFVLNMMSTGVRIFTDEGKTYLIFRKIGRYAELRNKLETMV